MFTNCGVNLRDCCDRPHYNWEDHAYEPEDLIQVPLCILDKTSVVAIENENVCDYLEAGSLYGFSLPDVCFVNCQEEAEANCS